MTYDLTPMKAPRAAGASLTVLASLVEGAATGALIAKKLLRDAGILALRDAVTDEPLTLAPPGLPCHGTADCEIVPEPLPSPTGALPTLDLPGDARPESVLDFARAYAKGDLTPTMVAERALAATAASEALSPAPLRIFIAQHREEIMALAAASTQRWKAGAPLSLLDGVPVAVKDELDQRDYPTTVGTSFLGKTPATEDATVVARLRAAGAVLLGKTNMHEIGLGVTGVNPHHGACRNPYDPTRATGGSSSGPAAAVAAGLCPIALGADGGGSIRIPASLCGVVGLKPTFGRVSEFGAAPLCWSVAHVGPIGATVFDVALAHRLIAGPDPRDPNTFGRPSVDGPDLADLAEPTVRGLRIGVFTPYFEDAEPAVVAACRSAVEVLAAAGARVVEVSIPRLALLRAVHLVTIVSEMAASHRRYQLDGSARYAADTRLNLALAQRLTSSDYVHAQRLRAGFAAQFQALFQGIDVLATPATGRTAPLIPADALKHGESNLVVTDQILRFALPANVLGYPAISVPAGYDPAGLPVGLQLLGRPFEETQLLRAARVVERHVPRRRATASWRLLGT